MSVLSHLLFDHNKEWSFLPRVLKEGAKYIWWREREGGRERRGEGEKGEERERERIPNERGFDNKRVAENIHSRL